jgi:hypothetical protein
MKQAQQFWESLLSDIFYENLKRGRTGKLICMEGENLLCLCHSRRYPLHGFIFYETSVTVYMCVARGSVMYVHKSC